MKKDKEALISLACWDRVPEEMKKQVADGLAYAVNDPIKSIQYLPIGDFAARTRTINGVTYTLNLPVTKLIKIDYDLKSGNSTAQLPLGEKDGKLMIANLAPQQ